GPGQARHDTRPQARVQGSPARRLRGDVGVRRLPAVRRDPGGVDDVHRGVGRAGTDRARARVDVDDDGRLEALHAPGLRVDAEPGPARVEAERPVWGVPRGRRRQRGRGAAYARPSSARRSWSRWLSSCPAITVTKSSIVMRPRVAWTPPRSHWACVRAPRRTSDSSRRLRNAASAAATSLRRYWRSSAQRSGVAGSKDNFGSGRRASAASLWPRTAPASSAGVRSRRFRRTATGAFAYSSMLGIGRIYG